jgi:hypothetical protein
MKPMNFVFGIRADGRVMKAGYLTVELAEMFARGLFGKGYGTVEVIDLVTRRCIKQVSPEVAPRAGA